MHFPSFYFMGRHVDSQRGFTLIELSIVLVVIGLIVGGILAGRDMIEVATARAQISQIEQYQAAVNTFRGKYNCLPGDCAGAADFGLPPRGTSPGQGDGDGVIEGVAQNTGFRSGVLEGQGETILFWEDLSYAELIPEHFDIYHWDGNANTINGVGYWCPDCGNGAQGHAGSIMDQVGDPVLSALIPRAKIGNGNYIYVYSGGYTSDGAEWTSSHTNYFGLSSVSAIWAAFDGQMISGPGLTVQEAFYIDQKIDDGLPLSGGVLANYVNGYWGNPAPISPIWSIGGQTIDSRTYGASDTSATARSPVTCYDNGGVNGGAQQYSMGQDSGANINCGVSIRFN